MALNIVEPQHIWVEPLVEINFDLGVLLCSHSIPQCVLTLGLDSVDFVGSEDDIYLLMFFLLLCEVDHSINVVELPRTLVRWLIMISVHYSVLAKTFNTGHIVSIVAKSICLLV